MSKKPKPFNNPFENLKLAKPEPKRPPKAPVEPEEQAQPRPSKVQDEARLFLEAVGEVSPVRGKSRVERQLLPKVPSVRVLDPEIEALTRLSELVAGHGPMDLSSSDEHIEGAAPGLDARILRKLRAGEYAWQGHLDLHGLTRAEAKEALERFLLDARRAGRRCVLIVHGRGLHSKDQIPILKEELQRWLSTGKLARQVLAFTSAKPHDGGVGAAYVLLRA